MELPAPDEFSDEVRARIGEAQARREAFLALPGATSADETVRLFDAIRRPLDAVVGRIGLLSAVHPDAELRDRAERLEQEVVAFETELSLDRAVYERLLALDVARLEGAKERRLLEHGLRDLRRAGVDGDSATRARVKRLQDEILEIGQRFDRNIVEGRRELRVPEGRAGLAGLPDDYLASHPEREDGSVIITTDTPDLLPVMLYAERDDVRQQLNALYLDRAYPENIEVLEQLLSKRHELATVLGYESWAAYATEDKMVKTAPDARAFIARITELARGRAESEVQQLLDELRKLVPEATTVHWHQHAWLRERIKRARFGFDSQEVRPYFAYGKVRDGVLVTSAALYGVEFRAAGDVAGWHPSVEVYEVLDGGAVIARFYLDMFPREGKFKHAAMFDVRHGIAGEVLPEAALVCNFPEPSALDPALLLHSQVRTFFHEFGHLLHHLFAGRQEYLTFSGISTEWDFVEVPSQMYEEWAWDTGVLQRFATHQETGEPVPEELVQRMRAAEEFGKGLSVVMQMSYALLSLTLYDRDPKGVDTTAVMRDVIGHAVPIELCETSHFQASFGHLNGYSAIYYTYMWSLVIAKDLFSSFDGDLMNGETANRYRETVLAAGGSEDAGVLVEEFLGREYGFEAWESWLNRHSGVYSGPGQGPGQGPGTAGDGGEKKPQTGGGAGRKTE